MTAKPKGVPRRHKGPAHLLPNPAGPRILAGPEHSGSVTGPPSRSNCPTNHRA